MIKITLDSQGWPESAHTLREILLELGFKNEKGTILIDNDAEILDAYPCLLNDDGMGYGVNEAYITEADSDIYTTDVNCVNCTPGDTVWRLENKEIKVFNLFKEVPANEKFLKKFNN